MVTLAQIYKTIAAIQTTMTLIESVKKATKGTPNSASALELEQALNPLVRKATRQIAAYSLKQKRYKQSRGVATYVGKR